MGGGILKSGGISTRRYGRQALEVYLECAKLKEILSTRRGMPRTFQYSFHD